MKYQLAGTCCSLLLATCATTQGTATYNGVYMPQELPRSVMVNGKVIRLPKGPLTQKQAKELLIQLRKSELRNAYAVRDARAYYAALRQYYGEIRP